MKKILSLLLALSVCLVSYAGLPPMEELLNPGEDPGSGGGGGQPPINQMYVCGTVEYAYIISPDYPDGIMPASGAYVTIALGESTTTDSYGHFCLSYTNSNAYLMVQTIGRVQKIPIRGNNVKIILAYDGSVAEVIWY